MSKKTVKFIDFPKSYKTIKKEILPAIDDVLTRGDLILRKDVEEFEKTMAKYIGTKYAVGVNSCTDALYLALRGLNIGPGDFVLVPSRTFVATAQVIIQLGAKPIFYDIDGLKGKLSIPSTTKALIVVHIEGMMADKNMSGLIKDCKKAGIPLIEDAAQALGATQKGKKAGSFGLAGCFSFYPAKILGCFGDGGMLVTNDKKMYEYVRDARHHFKNDARDWGINSRLDNLQAAVLNIKFKYLDKALKRREEIARMYDNELWEIEGLTLPPMERGRVWQDYIVRTKYRDELYNFLKENGIETMKNNYPFPCKKLEKAQAYEDETLRLPCNEMLIDKEINYVIKNVIKFYEKK